MVRGPDSRSVFLFILRFCFIFSIPLGGFLQVPMFPSPIRIPICIIITGRRKYRINHRCLSCSLSPPPPSPVCLSECMCLSPLACPRTWPGTLAPPPPPIRCKRRLVVRSGGNHHAICFLAFSYTLFASSVSSPLFLRLAGCAAFLVPQYKREREI